MCITPLPTFVTIALLLSVPLLIRHCSLPYSLSSFPLYFHLMVLVSTQFIGIGLSPFAQQEYFQFLIHGFIFSIHLRCPKYLYQLSFRTSKVKAIKINNILNTYSLIFFNYYYFLIAICFHSVTLALTLVQTKLIIHINETIQKHSTNRTNLSKYKYIY